MSRIRILFTVLAMSLVLTACANKEEKAKDAVNSANVLISEIQTTGPGIAQDYRKVDSMTKPELVDYHKRLTRYIQVGEEILRLSGTEGVVSRGMDRLQAEVNGAVAIRAQVSEKIKNS